VAAGCSSPTDDEASKLESEAFVLAAWGSDATLVSAVAAQNAQNLTLVEIQRRDTEWVAGRDTARVRMMTTGPYADRLRQLMSQKAIYGETFLMDNKGALVCASDPTTDYWQGDEEKFTRSYNNGSGATFIDKAQLDASSGERLVQISLPVRSGASVIGAITIGIRADNL
jgi:tartrate dehydratase beta subunit/fumarate hydratase class I family protein